MPRGNGTGPLGLGPMTGRGAGYCAGYTVPGFANPRGGRRLWGRGGGRGFGRGIGYVTPAYSGPVGNVAAAPKTALAVSAEGLAEIRELTATLTRSMEEVNKRLDALDAGKPETAK